MCTAFYSGDANFVPSTASQLAVSITPGVAVTTAKLPDATIGQAYHAGLAAAGGKQPYHWKITTGSLPPGLSLTASTGAINGTPTTTGTFSFTALVTDSTTPTPFKATAQLRIAVNPVVQPAVYVANGGNSSITYALGVSGDVAPLTTLTGATTGLNGTSAVTIAPDGRVFVASANNNSIREYPYGSSGNVKPATVIAGDATGLASPQALVLDGDGRLYVANAAGNSVTVYAPGATGNAKPIATLAGSTYRARQPGRGDHRRTGPPVGGECGHQQPHRVPEFGKRRRRAERHDQRVCDSPQRTARARAGLTRETCSLPTPTTTPSRSTRPPCLATCSRCGG